MVWCTPTATQATQAAQALASVLTATRRALFSRGAGCAVAATPQATPPLTTHRDAAGPASTEPPRHCSSAGVGSSRHDHDRSARHPHGQHLHYPRRPHDRHLHCPHHLHRHPRSRAGERWLSASSNEPPNAPRTDHGAQTLAGAGLTGSINNYDDAVSAVSDLDVVTQKYLLHALWTNKLKDTDNASVWEQADRDADGSLSKEEFYAFLTGANKPVDTTNVEAPSRDQLVQLFVRASMPMIGFGFVDNAIMLTAGDAIDTTFSSAFHISTLAAAGFGNLVSDVAGLGLSNSIENAATSLGMPSPNLSREQMALKIVRVVMLLASVIGISIGCLLGMIPLVFIDTTHRELWEIFTEVDTEGDSTISLDSVIKTVNVIGNRIVDEEALNASLASMGKTATDPFTFEEFRHLVEHSDLQSSS